MDVYGISPACMWMKRKVLGWDLPAEAGITSTYFFLSMTDDKIDEHDQIDQMIQMIAGEKRN
jgi:hypothetical protein